MPCLYSVCIIKRERERNKKNVQIIQNTANQEFKSQKEKRYTFLFWITCSLISFKKAANQLFADVSTLNNNRPNNNKKNKCFCLHYTVIPYKKAANQLFADVSTLNNNNNFLNLYLLNT
jgi:hypothetical protein